MLPALFLRVSNCNCCVKAVYLGHLAVHHNQIEGRVEGLLKGLSAVSYNRNIKAAALKKFCCEPGVYRIVLSQQHPTMRESAFGIEDGDRNLPGIRSDCAAGTSRGRQSNAKRN